MENKTKRQEKKEVVQSSVFLFILLLFNFCTAEKENASKPPIRLVGLTPNVTETLFAICPKERIVGRSDYCNFPANLVKDVPKIATYPLNKEQLISFNADLFIFKDDMFQQSVQDELRSLGIPLLGLKFEKLEDILFAMDTLSRICNCEEKGDSLKKDFLQKVEGVKLKSQKQEKKKVVYVISLEPLIVAGNGGFFGTYLTILNAENALDSSITIPYPQISLEFLLEQNPDVIIGISEEQAKQNWGGQIDLNFLKSYQNKKILDIDDDLLSRPGIRTPLCLEELYLKIHG